MKKCSGATFTRPEGGFKHALVAVAAMVGALVLARAVDDPRLSDALRESALKHFTPIGD